MEKVLQQRVLLVSFLLVAVLSAYSFRLYDLQILRHERYTSITEGERFRQLTLPASRGPIVDRHGELLVRSQPVAHVIADRTRLLDAKNCEKVVARAEGVKLQDFQRDYDDDELRRRSLSVVCATLGEVLGEDGFALADKLRDTGQVRIPLRKDLGSDEAERLRGLLAEKRISGISFEEGTIRFYPNYRTLAHVLGFVDAKGVGQEGIEKFYENALRGVDGHRQGELGGDRLEIAAYRTENEPARDGHSVVLTVDLGLQNLLEQVMDEAVEEFQPERMTAVFMNPMTGEILAMASRPDYNLDTRKGERKNLATSHTYEPGSTFKIISLAAAYDLGLVSPETRIFCHNGHYQKGVIELTDHGNYAYLTPWQILEKSSNIGAFMLAKQVGTRRLYEYVRNFGFGSRSGIELTAENAGVVNRPGSTGNEELSLSRVAMGYSIDVTALQVVGAMAAIANGGQLMRPYIVSRITDCDGHIVERNEPEVVRQVVSENAANQVRRAMIEVTGANGTAKTAAMEGYTLAGKTGTAQKAKEDAKGRRVGYHNGKDGRPSRYVVSFGGFLPAENPALVGVVIVDDPKVKSGPTYGGTVAAPIFRKFAELAMPYLGIEPSRMTRTATRTVTRAVKPSVDLESIPQSR